MISCNETIKKIMYKSKIYTIHGPDVYLGDIPVSDIILGKSLDKELNEILLDGSEILLSTSVIFPKDTGFSTKNLRDVRDDHKYSREDLDAIFP